MPRSTVRTLCSEVLRQPEAEVFGVGGGTVRDLHGPGDEPIVSNIDRAQLEAA